MEARRSDQHYGIIKSLGVDASEKFNSHNNDYGTCAVGGVASRARGTLTGGLGAPSYSRRQSQPWRRCRTSAASSWETARQRIQPVPARGQSSRLRPLRYASISLAMRLGMRRSVRRARLLGDRLYANRTALLGTNWGDRPRGTDGQRSDSRRPHDSEGRVAAPAGVRRWKPAAPRLRMSGAGRTRIARRCPSWTKPS